MKLYEMKVWFSVIHFKVSIASVCRLERKIHEC